MAAIYLKQSEVACAIKEIGPHRPVLVQGPNGIGKTYIQKQFMQDVDLADYIVVPPIDCTQLGDGSLGIPDLDRDSGVSRELPNERLGLSKRNMLGVNGSKPVVVCFDEVTKVPRYVKNMIAPIVYEGRFGAMYWPKGSIRWMTGNLGIEGLGDLMEPHLRNRIVVLNMRGPDGDEALVHAAAHGYHEAVMLAIKELPIFCDSFTDYEEGGKYHGQKLEEHNPYIFNPRAVQEGYVTPRSLEAASIICHAGPRMTDDALLAALIGAVGDPAARQIITRYRFNKYLPNFTDVVADPMNAPLTDNPAAAIFQVFQFLNRTKDRTQAAAIGKYLKRMHMEMQILFANSLTNAPRVLPLYATVAELQDLLNINRKFI